MFTLSVSGLNEQIKTLLETSFTQVLVEGELSRITFHNSGHIYFTLKDKDSAISGVMFRGNASRLKFRLEEGMKVIINAALTLYKPRGTYQLNCFSIEPSGQGALALAYEQLKSKLSSQGYFEQEHKKKLPLFPRKIALITSATGAALQDMLRVANTRYRLIEIDIYDVLVQGESAKIEIVHALEKADKQAYDLIILARGGGSIEDLWAFNEENVADAIYGAQTPIISAIGHEIDYLISDFVADVRAPTPSAAMEICLPDTNELLMSIDSYQSQLAQQLQQIIYTKKQTLQHLQNSFLQHSVEKKLEQKREEIHRVEEQFIQIIDFRMQNYMQDLQGISSRYPHTMDSLIHNAQNKIDTLSKMMESHNPKLKSKKGFAQISQDNCVVAIEQLEIDECFEIQSATVVIKAKVLTKELIL